jgi:hypothetical protein
MISCGIFYGHCFRTDFSRYVEKRAVRPNPPAPLTLIPIKFGIAKFNGGPEFPTREGGKIKASGLVGERNGSEVFQMP